LRETFSKYSSSCLLFYGFDKNKFIQILLSSDSSAMSLTLAMLIAKIIYKKLDASVFDTGDTFSDRLTGR